VVHPTDSERHYNRLKAEFIRQSRKKPDLVSPKKRGAGVIPFHKVGSHRRVKLSDALEYQSKLEALADLTREAQELGLGY
jgi:hypothetical protein